MIRLALPELLNLKDWQKNQDNFSALMGIGIRVAGPEGQSITIPSKEPRLCALLRDPERKAAICGDCLPAFLGGKGTVDKNLDFSCGSNAGLHNFIIPLTLCNAKTLGYIILGPVVLVMRKEKEQYRKIAENLGLDLEAFWGAILEIKVVSLQTMLSMVELISDVCEYTIHLAYGNIVKETKAAADADASRLNRIFDVLLDVAFDVSQADTGSVMSVDDSRDALTIRASRGIPEEIVKNTNVKFGEGISGIAAKEGKAFLIDDNFRDNRISPYLSRTALSSSIILPIKAQDRVVGVINLGTSKSSAVKLNSDNLQVLNRLVELVGAIVPCGK